MTGRVALDVVLGLVFIYLLYSLFATVILEIINSFLGLRARNLRYTIRRMLMDEKIQFLFRQNQSDSNTIQLLKTLGNFLQRAVLKIVNSFVKVSGKSSNLKDTGLFDHFYEQPSIKYLSSGGISNKPSYISPKNFTKTLIDTLTSKFNVEDILNKIDKDFDSSELVKQLHETSEIKQAFRTMNQGQMSLSSQLAHKSDDEKLKIASELLPVNVQLKKYLNVALHRNDNFQVSGKSSNPHEEESGNQSLIERIQAGISVLPEGSDTRRHLESLIRDANKDAEKFKLLLEEWFNDTMERASGWYKRRVQYFLLVIGFILAVSFNADTLEIVKKLSNDTDARSQLVDLAIAYNQENPGSASVSNKPTDSLKSTRDSLFNAAEVIRSDIYSAQNLISSNWKITDSITIGNFKEVPKDYRKHTYTLRLRDSLDKEGENKKVKVSSLLHKSIDLKAFDKSIPVATTTDYHKKRINVNQRAYKWYYVFAWQGWNFKHLWGYVLTALAISLGSPFWFDLMNKLIKLRSSTRPDQKKNTSGNSSSKDEATLINRVG